MRVCVYIDIYIMHIYILILHTSTHLKIIPPKRGDKSRDGCHEMKTLRHLVYMYIAYAYEIYIYTRIHTLIKYEYTYI